MFLQLGSQLIERRLELLLFARRQFLYVMHIVHVIRRYPQLLAEPAEHRTGSFIQLGRRHDLGIAAVVVQKLSEVTQHMGSLALHGGVGQQPVHRLAPRTSRRCRYNV